MNNKNELVRLCAEINSNQNLSIWKYWTAEIYGFGQYIREYGFYPKLLPLYIYTDHGPAFEKMIYKHELESDAYGMFFHSPHKINLWREKSNKPVYKLYSPFVFYRRSRYIKKAKEAKGTLAFPGHSTGQIEDRLDHRIYINQLKNLPQKFHPISICLHMHDINKGLQDLYLEEGFSVYTAGNSSDYRFTERFYSIIKKFKYTTSNMLGSYCFYSIEMGIPFFTYGTHPVFNNQQDDNLEKGEYNLLQINKTYKESYDLFKGPNEFISREQMAFVDYELGLTNPTGRFRTAFILYYAFIRQGNIINDILKPLVNHFKQLIRKPRLILGFFSYKRKNDSK